MANGYLGKISAIVTANTGDFKPKLDGAAKDVSSFARSVQSTLSASSAASTKALRDIYTEAQKFDRATKAANSQKLSFKGFDSASLQAATTKAKQLFSATAEVSKPLAAASKAFEKLSADVQGAFLPALISAQKATEALAGEIGRAGSVGEQRFERIRNKVDATVAAMSRLREAEGLVGSLATGRELAFQQPGMVAEFGRAKDLQARALGLAPDAIAGSQIAGLVSQQRSAADEVSRLYSALERVRNSRSGDAVAAQAALTTQLGLYSQLSDRIEREIEGIERLSAARRRDAEIDRNIGAFSRRATPVGDLFRLRAEDERRARDAEIDRNIGAFSRRATPVGDLFRLRAEDERRARDAEIDRNIGAFSRRATQLRPGYFGDNLERRARAMAGGDITAATEQSRSVDRIGQSIAATRGQLDSLPEAMRDRFIPQIQRATDQFATLARLGPGATRDQIALATREAERLAATAARAQRANAFTQQFGGAGRRGVEMGIQQVELGGYTAQLQVLQRMLSGVTTTARAQATGAFNTLRAAIENAAERGTLGLAGTRRQLQQLTQDAARATAAATGRGERGIMSDLRRAGDVGRGGLDRFTLAAQQAVFAIDDFFSVTGDASQRLRAMGNNLTQIGFIMGNTTGLVLSLAASLTAQGIVALIRYANSGREAQDSAKALTDTLEKQKSTVKELADAFRSFASEIASSGFKGASKDAAELSSRLDEIRKKQRERSTERDALLNPDVQRTRATINARERALADTSDIGRAATIRAEIRELRAQERAQIRAMQNRPRVSAEGAIDELDASRRRVSEGRVADIRFAAGGQAGAAPGLIAARREAEANAAMAAADRAGLAGAGTDAERMAAARRSVEAQLAASRATADSERGMFGTTYAGAAAEQEVARLEDLLNRLNAGIASALDKIEIEVSKQALLAAGRLGSSLESLEQAVGSQAALTLRVNTEMTMFAGQLRDAQQNLANAVEAGDTDAAQAAREEIEAIVDATSAHVAVAKSVASFGEALNRVSTQLASTVLGESQSAADQARRQANAAQAVAGRSPAAREESAFRDRRRDELDKEARAAQDREADIRRQRDEEVRRFEADARGGRLDKETQDLIRQRDEAQAEIDRARDSGETVSADAVRRRDEAQRGLDRRFEDSEPGQRARQRADDFDREQSRRRQREADIERGRELRNNPAERAGKELADNLRSLDAAFKELPFGEQMAQADDYQKDRRRIVQDAMRQQAPAIFGLADSVENAIMQGPSRSALQASDVTTTQGAAELNRLLRGDDSAKNQDLVELQKQSKALDELVTIARQNGAPPGIFDL